MSHLASQSASEWKHHTVNYRPKPGPGPGLNERQKAKRCSLQSVSSNHFHSVRCCCVPPVCRVAVTHPSQMLGDPFGMEIKTSPHGVVPFWRALQAESRTRKIITTVFDFIQFVLMHLSQISYSDFLFLRGCASNVLG